MASQRKLRQFQCKALQAASLGSVKLLRSLLHSFAKSVCKKSYSGKRSHSSKRQRIYDEKLECKEPQRPQKRLRRDGRKNGEEACRRESARARKEIGEWFSSAKEGKDFDTGDENSGSRRYLGRGEQREAYKKSKQRQDVEVEGQFSSEDVQTLDSDSSSSSSIVRRFCKQSSKRNSGISEEDEVNKFKKDRKHSHSRRVYSDVVNCRDAEGFSPLHHACRARSQKLVKYLISKGARVDARDLSGNTPLHIAASLGPDSVVSILMDCGADMMASNDDGSTPANIFSKKQAAARRAAMFKDQENWYRHLAEELSDNENTWWGEEWGEQSEQPDWEDPYLQSMADSRQGRDLYDEPFRLRDFLNRETIKSQGKKDRRSKMHESPTAATGDGKKNHRVLGPQPKISSTAQSYGQRWRTFSESYNLCLSYSDVPFPVEEGKEETLGEVLLHGSNPSMHRAALRKEILKWHPDKFLQKWGAKLQGPDHDRIVARVNETSQAIHQLYKTLTTLK